MSRERDEYFMHLAIEQAKFALAEDELPVGAVVALGGEHAPVSFGRKFKGGHVRLDHAEMQALNTALRKCVWDASLMTVYSTLEPCIMCFGTITNSRIRRIVYSMEDPYGGAASCFNPGYAPPRHQTEYPEVTGGVLREDARALFKEYFTVTKNPFLVKASHNPLKIACLA